MPQISCSFYTLKSSRKKPDTPCTESSTESEKFKRLFQCKVKATADTGVAAVGKR